MMIPTGMALPPYFGWAPRPDAPVLAGRRISTGPRWDGPGAVGALGPSPYGLRQWLTPAEEALGRVRGNARGRGLDERVVESRPALPPEQLAEQIGVLLLHPRGHAG